MAIVIEPKTGKLTLEESEKLYNGLVAEIDNLKSILDNVKEFGLSMQAKHDISSDSSSEIGSLLTQFNIGGFGDPKLNSTEAASQHIGYMESKIYESIGTIDKILLEMAVHVEDDKREDNATETPENRKGNVSD